MWEKCVSCGQGLFAGDAFCGNCGRPTTSAVPAGREPTGDQSARPDIVPEPAPPDPAPPELAPPELTAPELIPAEFTLPVFTMPESTPPEPAQPAMAADECAPPQ